MKMWIKKDLERTGSLVGDEDADDGESWKDWFASG